MKKNTILILLSLFVSTSSLADVGDLLISEIKIVPNNDEFIEIYNNGASQVTLTDVYITDATFSNGDVYYYNIVLGDGGGAGGFRDFNAKFPDGATIEAGEYQTIAIRGSTNFFNAYGIEPTYELYEDDGVADAIPDMVPATANSIDTSDSGLSEGTNDGEVAILYTWDGSSDFVQDLDYVVWGDKREAVSKTGITVSTHNYLDDTLIENQAVIATNSHGNDFSWRRSDFTEGTEIKVGGNGITGHNEMSEDLNNTFVEAPPSPNGILLPPKIIINEVDAVGTTEFVELYGTINKSLNGVKVVFYQGSDDTIYRIIDLNGETTSNEGYFLIGDTSLTPDVVMSADSLNDDASAVAIYFNGTNIDLGDSINDPEFSDSVFDAVVYHSGTPDEGGLLDLLNMGEPQVNENANSATATESNARCANGSGGKFNTSTYDQVPPTPGIINSTCPVIPYYINADPSTPVTLRTTLHDIIKGHTSYPYSAGTTDTWDVLGFADEDHNATVDLDPNVSERVWMVYRNNSFVKVPGFENMEYNREHTWPQSRGFSSPANNAPRTDAHHLMLSDVGYNGTRGNKFFDNCNPSIDNTCTSLQTTEYDGDGDGVTEGGNTGTTYPGNSNWTNNSVFEVWDFRKGDIARAMFYLDVRYEGLGEVDSTGTTEPNLVLVETPTSGPNMGRLSTLLEWHLADPVDDIERERNEVVFSYQGNRNPFIDHPEWVACIFESICPATNAIFSNGFED